MKQNLFVVFASLTYPNFQHMQWLLFFPLAPLFILPNDFALISSALLYNRPVNFNQICPFFSPPSPTQPPPPLHWALLMILGFGEGAQWQCWHLFEGLARCQPLSITPATRVTLLDLSPTNLSADTLCGRRTSGHSLFGIRTAKVPTGDLKMGGRKPLSGCYNAEEVRQTDF